MNITVAEPVHWDGLTEEHEACILELVVALMLYMKTKKSDPYAYIPARDRLLNAYISWIDMNPSLQAFMVDKKTTAI